MVNRHRMIVNSQPIAAEVSGTNSVQLTKPTSLPLRSLVVKGSCAQASTPTPDAPVDIVCNNGAVRYGIGKNLLDMVEENIVLRSYIDNDGVVRTEVHNFYNNKYIPVVGSQTYTWSTSSAAQYVSIMQYDAQKEFIQRNLFSNGSDTLSASITLQSNTAFVLFGSRISNQNITLNQVNAINWQFELGTTATDYEPYSEGIHTDGNSGAIIAGSRNLFNPDYYSNRGWYVTNNQIANSTFANATLIMPCKPTTTYSWWHCKGRGGCRAFEMNTNTFDVGDSAQWVISSPTAQDANVITSYTTSANAQYLCICFSRYDNTSTRSHEEQMKDFMVVEGSVSEAYAYEPYCTPQTASVPNLFSVGTYKDEYDAISGQVTRRVGAIVLDGTEEWREATHTGVFFMPTGTNSITDTQPILCNAFSYSSLVNTSMPNYSGKLTNTRTANDAFHLVYDEYETNIEGFKEYLAAQFAAGTPVIVLYPLITPVTEQLAPQKIKATNTITTTGDLSVSYWKAPF